MVYIITDYEKKKKTWRYIDETLQKVSECVDVRKKSYRELKEEEEMRERLLRESKGRVELGVRSVELRGAGDVEVSGVSQADLKVDGRIVCENFVFDKGGRLVGKGKIIK